MTFGLPGVHVKPLNTSCKRRCVPLASLSMILADRAISGRRADIALAIFVTFVAALSAARATAAESRTDDDHCDCPDEYGDHCS